MRAANAKRMAIVFAVCFVSAASTAVIITAQRKGPASALSEKIDDALDSIGHKLEGHNVTKHNAPR